jgi:hypothetical protein
MDNYGFILTRHVNSEKTNKYWNNCVKCLRSLYPFRKIVIIDDNSNYNFVKADFDYKNIEIIQSEFPGRGEILPYYYFYKKHFFQNAVILHDSVFIHQRILFEKLNGCKVLPLWYFNKDRENINRTMAITNVLNQKFSIQQKLTFNDNVMGLNYDKWFGCFGLQSYIQYDFLNYIEKKYAIFKLLNVVKNRCDRCCLERIFGIIFAIENPKLLKNKSLFGDIFHYQTWGYTYDNYEKDFRMKKLPRLTIKVWTGR